jgi:hypothetical protein
MPLLLFYVATLGFFGQAGSMRASCDDGSEREVDGRGWSMYALVVSLMWRTVG